ncbi:MAG: FmdE family protein [Sarcina sp.]
MNEMEIWKEVSKFHGHECGGLAIGFKAAILALDILECRRDIDEELVCISENDACGVDAIQYLLSCTVGKGNLLIKMTGKSAYSFFNRKNGKSTRLVLKEFDNNLHGKEFMKFLLETNSSELFDVKEVKEEVPCKAKKFKSFKCSKCKELTAEHLMRIENGEFVCLDCASEYRRFYIK